MAETKQFVITTEKNSALGTRVFLDGQEVRKLVDVRFEHKAGEVPVVKLDVLAVDKVQVEGHAEVEIIQVCPGCKGHLEPVNISSLGDEWALFQRAEFGACACVMSASDAGSGLTLDAQQVARLSREISELLAGKHGAA